MEIPLIPLIISILIILFFSFKSKSKKKNRLERINLSEWKEKTVLFVSAHADDIEATCGGTVSLLTSQGTDVHFLIATEGEKGCSNQIYQSLSNKEITETRKVEEIKAASILGVKSENIHYMGFNDSELVGIPHLELQQVVMRHIRKIQPTAIFTWHPFPQFELKPLSKWGNLGYHPDHQYIGRVTLDAKVGAGVGRLFPETGPKWSTPYFYFVSFSGNKASHYVDITSLLGRKTESFLAHETQYSDANFIRKLVEVIGVHSAETVSQPGVKAAETFLGYY